MPPSNKHELLLGDAITNAVIARMLREMAELLFDTGIRERYAIKQMFNARANELDAPKMPGTLDIPGVKDYVNATPPTIPPPLCAQGNKVAASTEAVKQGCDSLVGVPSGGSGQAAGLKYGVCTISDIDEARGAAGPEVEREHGPWLDALKRMYASACYDGVGQDFLTILVHIRQQAERIAELESSRNTLDIPGVKDYVNAAPPSLAPHNNAAPSQEGAGGSGPAAGLCFSNDWLRKHANKYPDLDDCACPTCGAIAGACANYPNCPSGVRYDDDASKDASGRSEEVGRSGNAGQPDLRSGSQEHALRPERVGRGQHVQQVHAERQPSDDHPESGAAGQVRGGPEVLSGFFASRVACDNYRRPVGILGGPCLNCGQAQPDHYKPTAPEIDARPAAGLSWECPRCRQRVCIKCAQCSCGEMNPDALALLNGPAVSSTGFTGPGPMTKPAAPSPDAALDEAMGWLNALASPHNILLEVRKKAAIIRSHIRQLAERIAELEQQGEVDSCVKIDLDYYRGEANRFKDERDALRARVAELERDATPKSCCGDFEKCAQQCIPLVMALRDERDALRAENERLDKAHNMALHCYSKALIDMDRLRAWRTWARLVMHSMDIERSGHMSGCECWLCRAIASAPKDEP